MGQPPSDDRLADLAGTIKGGDPDQTTESEGDPKTASLAQALYWKAIYVEILAMEEPVMERIRGLMAEQSPDLRHEVEGTSAPVVEPHADRFRERLGFWTARVRELE
jgi:hypothetical protein